LGRHAFITHIYHGLKPKQPGRLFHLQRAWRKTRTEKGANDEETTAPPTGPYELAKEGKKKKKRTCQLLT
jgi:hypothetical protein